MSMPLWFDEKADDAMATVLQATVTQLELSTHETRRRQQLLYDLELYLGQKIPSLFALGAGDAIESLVNTDQITFNVGYSIVNTIRNRICSFRPRAEFLPVAGDAKAERSSKNKTEMSDAWADQVKYQAEASFAFRDLLTGDGGVLKLYREGDQYTIARFPSWEFLVDEVEGLYGQPECFYHVRYLPLEQAAAKYGVEISRLAGATTMMAPGVLYATTRDVVRIIEAWRRGPDGTHAIVAGNERVKRAVWKYDDFPVIVGRNDERPYGFWGTGVMTPLRSIQLELNELQMSLREAHQMTSKQIIGVQEGEGVPEKVNNEYVRVVRFKNQPPVIQTPPAVNNEEYTYLETLKKQAYETIGISQFVAAGQKQPGINSAVAIRESSELQTDRLALLSQVWERMRVEAATWWWRLTRDLAQAEGIKPKWRAISKGVWREMVFDADDSEYEIRKMPSSVFGQTISARLDRAVEMIQAGWLEKEDAMKALDVPDLAPIVDIQLAERTAMEWLVDRILEDGDYDTPDPYIDAKKFHAYARARYLLTIPDKTKYSETNRSLLRRLIDFLERKAAAAAQAAAPAAAAPAPAPVQPAPPPAPTTQQPPVAA